MSKYFTSDELWDMAAFYKALRIRYNIQFPERLRTLDTIIEVLKNRATAANPVDTRPLCIIIYSKSDHNDAFRKYPTIDRMIELGYRVVYHEAGTEGEVVKHLKSATGDARHRAKEIFLGGHGSSQALALNTKRREPGDRTHVDERNFIDVGDFMNKDKFQLAKYLLPGGQVILVSCSTGEGGGASWENLANTIARTLPPSVSIHSFAKDSNIVNIELRGGKVALTLLRKDHGYSVHGRRRVK